jgi:hypothetical protein
MKNFLLTLILIFLLVPGFGNAAGMFDIAINEIAWMGTQTSANDEWMEFKNNTSLPINLSGWTLQTADEKIVIKLSGTIPANGFYLLERTDDTTLPDIKADQIYTGSLSNSGQDLWLYDTQNNIIDEADFYQGWAYGDNTTKQTMERTGNTTWQTSMDAGGTPGKENFLILVGASLNNAAIQKPAEPSYPNGIFLNEILPNPEGSDEVEEFIELYNSNAFSVDLSGWEIKDTKGTQTSYIIPKNTTISSDGFLAFKRPETKIILNNDEDGLNLYSPDGKTADSLEYIKAPLGLSYNLPAGRQVKLGSGWEWSSISTPGKLNSTSSNVPETGKQGLPKIENSVKNNNVEVGLAGISLPAKSAQAKNTSPWFLFFIALGLTIISAATVLFIKFKLSKTNVRT